MRKEQISKKKRHNKNDKQICKKENTPGLYTVSADFQNE